GIHLALQLSPLPLRLEPLAACAVRATGGLILLRDGLKKLNHYSLLAMGSTRLKPINAFSATQNLHQSS
ncbi:hypothetical protein, partial [Pseudomonas sp. GL-RE-29]|uniref:hypothetical protein n=1 Tax=Pseudomonas sp. GL-RE-29 TaxID=2832375 RepID=UPI001CBA8199